MAQLQPSPPSLAAATEQSTSVQGRMSFEEFLNWKWDPEARVEWVNGEAIYLPPITDAHGNLVSFLSAVLRVAGEINDTGIVRFEPTVMRCRIGGSGRCPDVLFVRTEHYDRIQNLSIEGPADLVIEVVSPSSVKTAYIEKRAEYEQGKVPEYWIVDPQSGETSFLVLNDAGYYHEASLDDDGRYICAALDGLAFEPSWFSQEPLPKIMDVIRGWGLLDA